MWRAGCVDEAHVRFGRRAEETDRPKGRHRASVRPHYHQAVHSETGQAPIQRWSTAGPFPLPTPAALREAFLWPEHRLVNKTATVSLHANTYQVEADLVGRKVELVFDPFDLTTIEVRWQGKPMGLAVPHRIGRHAHPKARPETPPAAPTASGIAYLPLIDAAHQTELANRVNFRALTDQASQESPEDT